MIFSSETTGIIKIMTGTCWYTAKNRDRGSRFLTCSITSRRSGELPLSRIWKDDPGLSAGSRVAKARTALEKRYASLQEEHPDWFADRDYREMTEETSHIELLANPVHCQAKEPVVYYEMTELMKRAEEEVAFPYALYHLQRLDAAAPFRSLRIRGEGGS